jgi:hypothetical protein
VGQEKAVDCTKFATQYQAKQVETVGQDKAVDGTTLATQHQVKQ